MAFYDMYPMGGMNVGGAHSMYPLGMGGMNVGGFPVGGMYGDMEGGKFPKKGTAEYDEPKWVNARAKAKATRESAEAIRARTQGAEARRTQLASLAQQYQAQNPQMSKTNAMRMARILALQDQMVKKARAPSKAKGVYKYNVRGDKKSGVNPQYVEPMYSEEAMRLAPFRSRLTVGHAKKQGVQVSQMDLAALDSALRSLGLGIEDLETGSGFWSDLGNTAMKLAPMLPMFL